MLKLIGVTIYLSFIFLNLSNDGEGTQSFANLKKLQFLSYDKIPTWVGVASDWQSRYPKIHIYDKNVYKGHADFISKGLKTGITFKQFKQNVRSFRTRKYLPFLLFDLNKLNIRINGLNYTWAVQIQDYGYKDNPQQMVKTTLKLLNRLTEYMNFRNPKNKGIIILAIAKKAKPNISIAKNLIQKGYPNETISQILKLSQANNLKILNPGVGVGYLRLVKANQENILGFNHKDILIYKNLPNRVPTVAGIITLEPRTPLSHVNLLAKNRGTFNLYTTSLKFLPGFKELIGRLVKIECSNQKVTIQKITIKDAKEFWKNNSPKKVDIPKPKLSEDDIINLGSKDSAFQTVDYVGAKAANYSLIQKSFPTLVHKGFALPFKHYFNVLQQSGADQVIESLLKQKNHLNNQKLEEYLQRIRRKIMSANIHPATIIAIRRLQFQHFLNTKIRLRSSTNCEDLPQFNGAGLYLSKGLRPTQGNRKIMIKLLQIYASLWTPLAFKEREFYQIDHSKVAMAILINEAFVKEFANGVVITIPQKKECGILVNSQAGENLVTNPEKGHVPESLYFKNHRITEYDIQSRSNLSNVFIQNRNLNPVILQLKNISIECHNLLTRRLLESDRHRFGVDIEFKIMKQEGGYRLFIKQLRLLGNTLSN